MQKTLLFTGHMIDALGRATPRFPQTLALEAGVVIANQVAHFAPDIGIASGARGGDIVFHEACRSRGIMSRIVLPFSVDRFEQTSVAGIPGSDWVDRFRKLVTETPKNDMIILNSGSADDPYDACNEAMLELAFSLSPKPGLLALWDGERGDGKGGTASMVVAAERAGCSIVVINPRKLLEG